MERLLTKDELVLSAAEGRASREGWAEASREIALSGEGLAWPEFVDDEDDGWVW